MNSKHIDANVTGNFVIGEVSRRITGTVTELLLRLREERRALNCQAERKRQMQNQLYRDAIVRLPLEMIDKYWARR